MISLTILLVDVIHVLFVWLFDVHTHTHTHTHTHNLKIFYQTEKNTIVIMKDLCDVLMQNCTNKTIMSYVIGF
jgi:hypothetical protein